jgi:hypothetical protein
MDRARDIVAQVKELLDNAKVRQPPFNVLLGEITYQSTDFSTSASISIKDWLRRQFESSDDFVLVEPPRLRGIEVVEKPKSTGALAELAGADIWLTGEYWKTAGGIDLRLRVTKQLGNQFLGAAATSLPSGLIPVGANEVPANLAEALANQKIEEQIAPLANAQSDTGLNIEVWVDRGKGAVYVEGDQLLVFVRVNRDAYVRLYYTDATNQTYQIYPNRYHPEEKIPGKIVKRIPEPQDTFSFRVKAPFGIETLTALAGSRPFGDMQIASLDAGPFQKLPKGLRGLEVVSSAAKGDVVRDRFVLTTVPSIRVSEPSREQRK